MDIVDIMRPVVTIDQDATLEQAVETMVTQDVNALLVVCSDGKLKWSVDVVTLMKTITPEYIWNREASVANFVTPEMFSDFIADNKHKKVKYFMLETPKTLKHTTNILDAAMRVTEWRQSRIPVLDEHDTPIGIVTRQEVKRMLGKQMWFDTSKCR